MRSAGKGGARAASALGLQEESLYELLRHQPEKIEYFPKVLLLPVSAANP
jgi:hypothetical protein